jgi:hypothetical protein
MPGLYVAECGVMPDATANRVRVDFSAPSARLEPDMRFESFTRRLGLRVVWTLRHAGVKQALSGMAGRSPISRPRSAGRLEVHDLSPVTRGPQGR